MSQIQTVDTVSLGDITARIAPKKLQIACTFALVVGAVGAFTFLMPKQYQSHMKILVKNERADMIVSAGGGDGSGYHGEVSEAQINSEIELLNGLNLLQHVVTVCGLEKLEKPGAVAQQERLPVAIERATLRLQRDLTITPVRKANIIQVDYSARNPSQAASVLRQLAESYLEAHLKVHGTAGTYQFFASQAERYENELKDAEAKLDRFRQEHNIVMLAQQTDVTLQKASESEAALMQAEAAIGESTDKVADTRRQLSAAPSRIVTQSRTIPNQYSIDHLTSTLVDLQNRRTQLLEKFLPDNRLVQETEKEIADTRAALDRATQATASEQSTDVNPLHQALEVDMAKQQAELAGVEARRRTLERQAQIYQNQLMALAHASTEYDDLTRTQKKAEENYLLYARKTEEARIAESLDRQKIANVAIAEQPTEPHLPSKPNVKLNLTLGVLLAGFLSLGLPFGAEYLRQPSRPAQIAAQPVLGAADPAGALAERSDVEMVTGRPVLATIYLNRQPPV